MKTFTFRFEPNAESMSKRLLRAVRTGKPDVHPDELICTSYKVLLEIATESKLEILKAIISEKPESLYALAKLVKKDQAYVLKEARILAALGIINLKKEKSGAREKLRPVALYDNIVIDCGMGNMKKAANE